MNKVILIGRLTRDPELRRTQSGKSVTSFTIAVDRRKKDDGADFVPCVAWEGTAEAVSKYVSKGRKIAVYGRIATRSYEKDGAKKTVTEIVADEVEFVEPKNSASANYPEVEISDDDLPF